MTIVIETPNVNGRGEAGVRIFESDSVTIQPGNNEGIGGEILSSGRDIPLTEDTNITIYDHGQEIAEYCLECTGEGK